MWHSRVVYGTSAGSYGKVSWKSSGGRRPRSVILRVSHVAKEPWCVVFTPCYLTPPALGFDTSSSLDLLIGYPQAIVIETSSHPNLIKLFLLSGILKYRRSYIQSVNFIFNQIFFFYPKFLSFLANSNLIS